MENNCKGVHNAKNQDKSSFAINLLMHIVLFFYSKHIHIVSHTVLMFLGYLFYILPNSLLIPTVWLSSCLLSTVLHSRHTVLFTNGLWWIGQWQTMEEERRSYCIRRLWRKINTFHFTTDFFSKRCLPTGLFAVGALICLAPGHEYSTPKIKQEAKVREGNLNTWQCFNAVIYFKYINT